MCATLHFVAALAAFAWSFSVSSDAFDGRPVSALGRLVAGRLTEVLWFPMMPLVDQAATLGFRPAPGLQWLLLGANSALWGLVAALLVQWARARMQGRGEA